MITLAGLAALSNRLALAAAAANLVQTTAAQMSGLTGQQKLAAAVQGVKVLDPNIGSSIEGVVVSAEALVNASVAIFKQLEYGLFTNTTSGPAPAAAPAATKV